MLNWGSPPLEGALLILILHVSYVELEYRDYSSAGDLVSVKSTDLDVDFHPSQRDLDSDFQPLYIDHGYVHRRYNTNDGYVRRQDQEYYQQAKREKVVSVHGAGLDPVFNEIWTATLETTANGELSTFTKWSSV